MPGQEVGRGADPQQGAAEGPRLLSRLSTTRPSPPSDPFPLGDPEGLSVPAFQMRN